MTLIETASILLSLFLLSAAQTTNSTDDNSSLNYETKNFVITTEDQCSTLISVNPSLKYKVQMNLLNSSCLSNPGKKGFNCGLTFQQRDGLALVGAQLCIDIQGIPRTIPDTQLTFTVYNQLQQKLRSVYTISRLYPEDAPYYVCVNESQKKLSVSISVLNSVNMCPYIMDKMVGSVISLGTVMMKPVLPTYMLTMDNCSSDIVSKENEYIVKVDLQGFSSYCNYRILNNHSDIHTNSCIELLYVSLDYKCNISIELFMVSHSIVKMEVPLGFTKRQQICYIYSGAGSDGPAQSSLIIQKYNKATCYGTFAIKATFTETNKDTISCPEIDIDNMRQIYMAVFISLISVCLIILCITCAFCLYMRSKRRRAQRHGNAASNIQLEPHGRNFNNDVNINEVYGLPTYDDIFGKNSDVTANQPLPADQKPPEYDDLFTSSV